jgi:hypothetical protein
MWRIQHNAFVRDVGRLVDADDIHDMELVLAAVREAMRQQKLATYPVPPKESAAGARQRRSLRTTKVNANAAPRHEEEDYQKLKKRLTTALKVGRRRSPVRDRQEKGMPPGWAGESG